MINKIKKRKCHIRKNSIKKIYSQMGWKGRGTQVDPHFIEKGYQYPIDLTITGTITHIFLKNQQFTTFSNFNIIPFTDVNIHFAEVIDLKQ